jgi:ABC-2 type transport system permease protein
MRWQVLLAVFRRNLVSYFSNPTGYVFVCVFVALSSVAAFWSPAFFDNNLANLAPLNFWFPPIMLFFVPAITMSLWADERKQSTDELLLTLPVTDLDIVLGKYLAAVTIFAVSLLFSLVSNFLVLNMLGRPDVGMFISTYLGYLVVGMAMLSVGMVASFLTANISIAFVLGALFNAPLVALQYITTILPRSEWALDVKAWSIGENFRDFGRGVLSLSSLTYFASLIAVMLFISLVLIGRRHWLGGRDGRSLLGHYVVRTAALVILGLGVCLFFRHHDFVRLDLSSDGLNSLSPDTRTLLAELEPKHTIDIDAYISPSVPEAYVQPRLDLLAFLRELDKHPDIVVRVYDTKPYSKVAKRAQERYGISRKRVRAQSDSGKTINDEIFLGAAFRCGLNKVVVPFFELGIPIEYELVRSLATVSQPERKTLGVVQTDAALFGKFGSEPQQIIGELKKQYEVIEVDPRKKIVDSDKSSQQRYDALLVVQPSSLPAPELKNVVDAVKAGMPTAIFEDPFPAWVRSAPGTSQPRRHPQPFFMMQQQPPTPKGDIDELWHLLGINMAATPGSAGYGGGPPWDALIVWQDYNPYPVLREQMSITSEWIFASPDAPGGSQTFNDKDPITAGLKELLLLFPGAISKRGDSDLDFIPLVKTGTSTGTIHYRDAEDNLGDPYGLRRLEYPTDKEYVLAARIRGKVHESDQDKPSKANEINAVVVTDIDLLDSTFLQLRAEPIPDLDLHFQNIPFVLNVIDSLAGDSRFINVRKREQQHRTLSRFEEILHDIRKKNEETVETFREEYRKKTKEAENAKQAAVEQFKKTVDKMQSEENADYKKVEAALTRLSIKESSEESKEAVTKAALKRQLAQDIKQNEDKLKEQISDTQFRYRMMAVMLPPLPPLLLAAFVLLRRRLKEKEGVARSRLR